MFHSTMADTGSRLQLNLPVTAVHDLVIHGDDLVIATHGRSFWILDDITPLRQTREAMKGDGAWLYRPATAVRVDNDTFWEHRFRRRSRRRRTRRMARSGLLSAAGGGSRQAGNSRWQAGCSSKFLFRRSANHDAPAICGRGSLAAGPSDSGDGGGDASPGLGSGVEGKWGGGNRRFRNRPSQRTAGGSRNAIRRDSRWRARAWCSPWRS